MTLVAPEARLDAAPASAPAERHRPAHGIAGWPLPLPTRRAATAVAVCSVVAASGVVFPILGWVALALVLLVLVAVVADWVALPDPARFVTVRRGRPALPLGGSATVDLDILLRGDDDGTGFELRVVDDLHDRIHRTADPAPTQVLSGRAVSVSTPVAPRHRGRFVLGDVHARVTSRLGLAERELRFEVPLEVRVVPGLSEMAEAAKVLRRAAQREAGLRRTRTRGQGTSFESLREYVRGDDPRHVDWKSSARHAKLICRQYEVERSQTVLFMIDAGRWMTSEVDGLTRLDRVLNAALLLAHVATQRDDRVGVLVFDREVRRFVPPGKGRAAVERLMEAVFDIEAQMVESDYRKAFAHLAAHHRKRSLVVLFTDILSKDQSQIVMEECRRSANRHLPLAVTLRDVGLDDLAERVPGNASGAYRVAAAEELLLEREQALATMRRAGVHVLDVPPALLAPSVVDRYLELKARMLL